MKVLIVGAGISGLSAAIGLRKAGHETILLDKSSLSQEVGAAIHVQPNASRVLLSWGFNTERARFVTAKSGIFASAHDLKTFDEQFFDHIEYEYGAKFYYSHRVDLHEELMKLATEEEGEGIPARVRNRAEVVKYNTEAGTVTLKDGSTLFADLIIGADGVHSAAVKEVVGFDNPAISTGVTVLRTLIPVKDIIADEECASLMDNLDGRFGNFIIGKSRVIWYPCRGQALSQISFIFLALGWNIPVDNSTFLNEARDYHPSLRALLRFQSFFLSSRLLFSSLAIFSSFAHSIYKAPEVKLWKLLFRAPLPTWHKGRLVIIGDAAHPMLPYQGQAGAQAIEDGLALGLLFSHLPDHYPSPSSHSESTPSSSSSSSSPPTNHPQFIHSTPPVSPTTLELRLQSFEKVRRNRASAMQMFSNAGQDEAEKVMESARPYVEEGVKVPSNPKEYTEYNFRHDVRKVCEQELRRIGAVSVEV
ncbi:salicylate hydroxylase protein [Rutstroemia sp. NJR-2017a BVV2]|nr:salicylate hydroxylase protein [Rutstroemia sp. NJR-2017a BVV2]PQE23280.1 salicylate hydroxylase protein [Rutstroemia sp. NJR-2017a BVV2]